MGHTLQHDRPTGRHAGHRMSTGEDGDHVAGAVGHHDFVGRDARARANPFDHDLSGHSHALSARHVGERGQSEVGDSSLKTFLFDFLHRLSQAFAESHEVTLDPVTVGSAS